MKKLLGIALTIFACGAISAQTIAPELPDFPHTPLSAEEISKIVSDNSQKSWEDLAKSARIKAEDAALKQFYPDAASWIYTAFAAELFAKEGSDLQPELKAAILKDLPAFFDFYESIRPEDSLSGACAALKTIFGIYPIAAQKYLRSAFAVSLIYDSLPPGGWPECNVPSNPAPITQPEEMFNFFMEEPQTFILPFDRMTVGELVFVFGIAGPMDELRGLKNEKITPFIIEKLTQSIKTDTKRLKGRQELPWDDAEGPYTPENIRKRGGLDVDKVYYAWRVANANGIPCLYFSERTGGKVYSWLWYMSRPGIWKTDIARDPAAKSLYGRPLNPQTWKNVELSDLLLCSKRHLVTPNGAISMAFFRLSELFFAKDDYSNAAFFADMAKKENPENWKAYGAYISAKARSGAPSSELDVLWRRSYEAFRKYPDICMNMLNKYRANLGLRRRQKEANRLFIAEMRTVMRVDPGFGIDSYSKQLRELFANLEDKSEMFSIYQDVLRNCSSCPDECFNKIVSPLAELFSDDGDAKSAQRVISMFSSSLRQDDAVLKKSAQALYDKYEPPRSKKARAELEDFKF